VEAELLFARQQFGRADAAGPATTRARPAFAVPDLSVEIPVTTLPVAPRMSEPAPSSTPFPDFSELLGPELASALTKKGYTTLTPVQHSVLDPAAEGRDLRISSQTGSGKTLAIGFALRNEVSDAVKPSPVARPQALVIVPTRELAKQVNDELGWLYAPLKLRIASVTGGSSYRDEHRALASGPAIVVGTPGRLLDHLNRGGIEASDVTAVVLDEADRMLDLGFRDELEAILEKTPPGHRTHLVSATFARDVAALADRVQKDPKRIEGTPLGSANRDIDHIVYLVNPRERVDALINVLLHHADEQTLVFARTRADVSEISRELQQAGFASGTLSGEMDQNARNRALSAFKRGEIRALIATDVAARGIDVQDIGRVIQLDPPTDPDTYTHRSGRTGRAGRKGVSAVLVAPAGLRRAASLLQRARVQFRIEPIPTAAAIREAQDARWLSDLMQGDQREVSERVAKQVQSIVESGLTERALAQLIISVRRATGEPREVTPLLPEAQRSGRAPARPERGRFEQRESRFEQRSPQRFEQRPEQQVERSPQRFERDERPTQQSEREPRQFARDSRQFERGPAPSERPPAFERGDGQGWVPFRVSWGEAHGADARRLVAMLCRRGNIRGSDIGAIRVNRTTSMVEVAASVASGFAESAREPDPRDPRVMIAPMSDGSANEQDHEQAERPAPQRPRAHVPPSQHRPSAQQRPQRGPSPYQPGPKPMRDFAPKPARDFAPKPARDFAPKPARDFAPKPARDFAPKPVRDFAPKPTREAPSKPAPDVPPKRPTRKIVVNAPPPRRGPKKK
jgi:ATP-dependent RNA helicase DeaD